LSEKGRRVVRKEKMVNPELNVTHPTELKTDVVIMDVGIKKHSLIMK